MLKNHLSAIKGRLLLHFTEVYSTMCTDSKGETDYEEFFEDIENCLKDIYNINPNPRNINVQIFSISVY